jgi:CubicO group peptidase (beta-lactamase class C family)
MHALLHAALLAVAQEPGGGLDPSEVWELLDGLVPAQMRRDQVPGAAVAVVMEGELVFLEGYGLARLEPETPVSAETTLFRIGSVSKVFTALALARVVERRGLALEDELAPHLGGLEMRTLAPALPPLRFWHLLTHSAGFDQIGLDRQALQPAEQLTPRQFLEGRLVRVRAPGESTCYDTYAITLAGYLVEQFSGKPFARALREEIFVPLGMERTFVQAPAELRGELALGYGLEQERLLSQPYEHYNTQPASSIDSTAQDMARFLLALLADGPSGEPPVFSAAMLALLRRPQYRNHPELPGFTLGFWEEWHGAERAVWHGGTMLGFSTRLTLLPERRFGVFSACNRDGETGPFPRLHDAIIDALAERLVAPEPARTAPADDGSGGALDLARFAGSYADNMYCHTCPEGRGWGWRPFEVRAAGERELEFFGSRWRAEGALLFRRRGGDPAVFRADARGRITHLFVGNLTYERIGETLLEGTFGADWRERADEPLVKRVLGYRPGAAPVRLPTPLDLSLPVELRARWAGKYRTDSGFQLEVASRGAELWLIVPGREDRRLLYQGGSECRVQGNDALRIVFREEDGRVAALTFHDDDGTEHEIARVP